MAVGILWLDEMGHGTPFVQECLLCQICTFDKIVKCGLLYGYHTGLLACGTKPSVTALLLALWLVTVSASGLVYQASQSQKSQPFGLKKRRVMETRST